MADPLSITAVFAFLNSAVKFSELAVKLYSVDSENGVFVRMIQTVRQDLEETERLLSVPSVRAQLISTPAKLPWIKGVIISTKSALNEIGRWVERVRGDKEGFGSVTLENRMRWVFNDHDKLVNRRMELGSSHQALSTVLMYLSPLEQAVVATTGEPPEYQDATFLDAYISPTQRRKHIRMSQKSSMQLRKDETISDAAAYQPRTVNNITDPIFRKEEGVGGEGLPMIPTGNTTGAEGTLNLTQPHNLYPDSKLDMTLKGEKSSSACGSADIVPTSTTSSSFLQISNLTSGQQSNSPLTTVQAEYPTSITTPTATSNYPQPWSQRQESFSLSSQDFGSVSAPWVSDRQSPLGEEIHRSSLPALPPKIPVETLKHRFSATSFGPVDPFGFTCEVESNGLSSFDGDPKDRNSAKSAAETKDNNPFDVPHTVSSEPRAELPAIPPNVQSAYLNSTTTAELPAWSQARPPWSELPGCSILFKPSSTRQEKAQQNLYNNSLQYTFLARPQSDAFRNRASSYTMTRSELPGTGTSSPPRTRTMNSLTSPSASLASITAPQLPRPQSEYQPYRVPQPIPEAQVQIQPAPIYQYQSPNQYPYQNYQTLSSEAPTSRPVSVASTLPPYPMDFRDQRLGYSTPVSPEVQPVLPDLGAQESQSTERTLTLREARRRNQKVLLDIMSSESSG